MAEQEQNPTEPATPFKLEEARKRGQVARSLDFNSLVMAWVLLFAAMMFGEGAWRGLAVSTATVFAGAAEPTAELGVYLAGVRSLIGWTVAIVAPVALLALVLSTLANVVQSGPVFSSEQLKPKLERINPIAGFKRIYSKRMLFETFKSVLKLVLFTATIAFFFAALWPHLGEVATPDPNGQTSWFAEWGLALLFRLALILTLLGLLDFAYARWTFARQMRMSRRELKDEVKRREGDPLIKAKVRELQRERLKQMQSTGKVGEADVLITNPTHLAVALKYVRGAMDAPEVIAKGSDTAAADMRLRAARHGVPIVERPLLARQLYRRTRVGQAVPPETFIEVARVYSVIGARKQRVAELEVRP
jgi:flagellar biosynthetic protein FlhB